MNNNIIKRQTSVQLFKRYVFSPFQNRNETTNEDQIQYIIQEIYNWARNNGAQYISFLSYPIRNSIAQKQVTFLNLKFLKDNLFFSIGSQKMKAIDVFNCQVDGSSLPNGNLRKSHQSRTYLLWDHRSELFIRKKERILYIPCFLMTPQGYKLDDRAHFRKAEKVFQQQFGKLLNKLNIQHKGIFFSVGLEQQFFVIPKQAKQKRLDIKQTGRALIGPDSPFYPVSRNYLKKISQTIQKVLRQVQQQLLELGVPIKARNSQGAPNQYQLNTQMQNASLAIDHNILVMQILQQFFQRNGFSALFHQKPFKKLNGSGKHLNWSISYLNNQQKLVNILDRKYQNQNIFALMILMVLKAGFSNHKLLLASTANPGNEVRLGQNQAPLQILSYNLGKEVQTIIQGIWKPEQKNLKQRFKYLLKDFNSEIGERNRTSTMAYSSNRFQFRLCGSSHNITFPIIIIMSTLIKQIKQTTKKLQRGISLKYIIDEYRQQTRKIRFQGDNYSQQWKIQAQKRGIYNKKAKFIDFIKAIKINGQVLVQTRIYGIKQLQARQIIMNKQYIDAVINEKNILVKILNKNIIPRCFDYMSKFPRQVHLKNIQYRMKKIDLILQQLLKKLQQIQKIQINQDNLEQAYQLRQKIFKLSDSANKILQYLPQTENFPQLHHFLNTWK